MQPDALIAATPSSPAARNVGEINGNKSYPNSPVLLAPVSCNERSSRWLPSSCHLCLPPASLVFATLKQLAAAIRKCYQLRNAWRLTKWTLMASWQPTNSINISSNNNDNNKIIARGSVRKTWRRTLFRIAHTPRWLRADKQAEQSVGSGFVGGWSRVDCHLGTLKLNCKLNIKVVHSEMSS